MLGADNTARSEVRNENCVFIYHRSMMDAVGNECSPPSEIFCIVRIYRIPRVQTIDLNCVDESKGQHEIGLYPSGHPFVHCQLP